MLRPAELRPFGLRLCLVSLRYEMAMPFIPVAGHLMLESSNSGRLMVLGSLQGADETLQLSF